MASLYVPKQFEQQEDRHLAAVMHTHNFATLVSVIHGEPFATHLPVIAQRLPEGWQIESHVARANPHWQGLAERASALMIFHGPHTYVSPTQYRSWQRVPTWNYITVHARGTVELIHDEGAKMQILRRLIDHHDPDFALRWDQFEAQYRHSMLAAIVGLRMTVSSLEGKFKLNQHRLADDRAELAKEYAQGDENRRALAQWMATLGLWPQPAERL